MGWKSRNNGVNSTWLGPLVNFKNPEWAPIPSRMSWNREKHWFHSVEPTLINNALTLPSKNTSSEVHETCIEQSTDWPPIPYLQESITGKSIEQQDTKWWLTGLHLESPVLPPVQHSRLRAQPQVVPCKADAGLRSIWHADWFMSIAAKP